MAVSVANFNAFLQFSEHFSTFQKYCEWITYPQYFSSLFQPLFFCFGNLRLPSHCFSISSDILWRTGKSTGLSCDLSHDFGKASEACTCISDCSTAFQCVNAVDGIADNEVYVAGVFEKSFYSFSETKFAASWNNCGFE